MSIPSGVWWHDVDGPEPMMPVDVAPRRESNDDLFEKWGIRGPAVFYATHRHRVFVAPEVAMESFTRCHEDVWRGVSATHSRCKVPWVQMTRAIRDGAKEREFVVVARQRFCHCYPDGAWPFQGYCQDCGGEYHSFCPPEGNAKCYEKVEELG